jgi:hypothetical protein
MLIQHHIAADQFLERNTIGSENLHKPNRKSMSYKRSALKLIVKLCQALVFVKITYCHWKSNNSLDRSASGEKDLDLLVSRTDVKQFVTILFRIGYSKQRLREEHRDLMSLTTTGMIKGRID